MEWKKNVKEEEGEVYKKISHCVLFRVLLRLEFQVADPILRTTLATDQKRPSSQIHIS